MNEPAILTKYEMTLVLGIRAQQLSNGAPPMISTDGMFNEKEIALKELYSHKMPLIIKRKKPGGSSEFCKVSEMIIE